MLQYSRLTRTSIILAHGIIGWAYCGMLIGVGRKYFTMDTTLIIHAIGAPLGFAAISYLYFGKFYFTSPAMTASLFMGIVVVLDALLVAPFFERSFAMFSSVLGTWIPFALIWVSTYLTGRIYIRRNPGSGP